MMNTAQTGDGLRDKAKTFFDRGDVYLRKEASIDLRARLVRSLLGNVDGCRVLDVGCGDGRVSLQLLPEAAHITLLDMSENMLARAAKRIPETMRNRVSLTRGVAQDFVPSAPFDVVLCIGVFAHVSDSATLWRALSEFVGPGGRCIVQISDYEVPMGKVLAGLSELRRLIWDSRGYQLNLTRYSEFVRMASESGLDLVGEERYWRFPPGVGVLPDSWMRHVYDWTRMNPQLRHMASERLILFRRR